jgi:ADP-heptose:LPS heptosyltransferase
LAERCGARIVLTGSEPEQPLTARVRQSMRRDAVDLAGQTGLGEFAAVIAALDLLVTNDTGASHVAAATRTPSVVLYGPSRPERWGPLDQDLHCRIDVMDHVAGSDSAAALQRLPVARVLAECVAMRNAIDPIANETTEERIA